MFKQLFTAFVPQKDQSSVSADQRIGRHSEYLVTQANLPEEKLQLSELRYRRLFETAQDGILILDANSGKIEDVNPFLKEMLGYSREELLGKQLWEIGAFKDIFDSKKAFLELQNKGYIRYKDLPLQAKDGRSIDVEFVSNVYSVGFQKVIQCNIRDITERKKTEKTIQSRTQKLEQLSQEQERTKQAMLNVMEDLEAAKAVIEIEKAKDEAILASIGDGLIAVNNDRQIMIVNKAAEEILGWEKKDLLGKEITSLPLEDEKGNSLLLDKRPTYQAFVTGKVAKSSYFFVRKDKTRFQIAINVTPIELNGKIIGALDVFRDVTRDKEIDRAKSEFVSLASHQLRTPLGITKWYLEALENNDYFKKTPLDIRKHFDEIYKSNERVLSLVRDLLSVSRIEQGRVKNVPKAADIIKIVTEIVEQMQIMAKKKKVALHMNIFSQKIPFFNIDVLRLHEVIENLVGNAIEYTEAAGVVVVTVKKQGDTLLLSVKDTGIGISHADQEKLFTKFFRSEKAISYNPEGSGLGLYVVKSYVEGWGGKISVESDKGKGSTFTITLPISQKMSPPNLAKEPSVLEKSGDRGNNDGKN